jgi:hypothetical protein
MVKEPWTEGAGFCFYGGNPRTGLNYRLRHGINRCCVGSRVSKWARTVTMGFFEAPLWQS